MRNWKSAILNRAFFFLFKKTFICFFVLTWLFIKKNINIFKSFKEIMSVFWLCQMYTVYIIDGFRYIGYLYTSVPVKEQINYFDAWVLVSNQTVQCCLNCKFTTLGPICICLLNADLLCFNMYILLSCMTRGRHPLSLTSNTCLIAIV